MPLVGKLFGPHGLVSWRISELASLDGSPAPYQIQADLIFKDVESVGKAFAASGQWNFGSLARSVL